MSPKSPSMTNGMLHRTFAHRTDSTSPPVAKRRRRSSLELVKIEDGADVSEYGSRWADWPAPRDAMAEARAFILDM